ncbi:MAG: hypothetical protein Q9N62_01600 [Ghiorsea sp.]|nr:hypothetical protein [Ghiorsea sp.]
MCGFCDEVICAFDVVKLEIKGEPIEPYENLVCGYLHETQDVTSCVQTCLSAGLDLDAESLICRTWEMMLNTNHQKACYALMSLSDIESVGDMLQTIRKFPDFDAMAKLGDFRIYQDEVRWQRLMMDKPLLIAESKKVLQKYCDFWLIDDTKDMVSHDPFEVPSPYEWGKFYEWFPAVFFAYAVLAHYQVSNDLFEKIATKHVVNRRLKSTILFV